MFFLRNKNHQFLENCYKILSNLLWMFLLSAYFFSCNFALFFFVISYKLYSQLSFVLLGIYRYAIYLLLFLFFVYYYFFLWICFYFFFLSFWNFVNYNKFTMFNWCAVRWPISFVHRNGMINAIIAASGKFIVKPFLFFLY